MRISVLCSSMAKYLVAAVLVLLSLSTLAQAGSIVVSNDEWFTTSGQINRVGVDNAQFAQNIASFLTGGSGDILILSGNFGLANTALINNLTSWGYNVTQTTVTPASLASYEAVFLGGMAVNTTLLSDYVNAGGNVFLEAGTGTLGGSAGEAATWNPFLNPFGLGLVATTFNGVSGDINVAAFQAQLPYGPELFAAVNLVYMNNGNNVILDLGTNPAAQVFVKNGNGLFGAVQTTPAVPEPASLLLLGSGLIGLAGRLRSKGKA